MRSKNSMIGVLIFVVVAVVIGLLLLCAGKSKWQQAGQQSSVVEALTALRSNEQMLEFILKSAKEEFGDPDVTLTEYGYGHSRTALELIIPRITDLFKVVIYPCADKAEYDYINNCLYADAAEEFRSYPVRYYHYGNMIIVLYSAAQDWQVESFFESVVIDARQGMVLAERWQEWLAEKGVEMKIADEGFGFINNSLSGLVCDVYQTLPLRVDGSKVELICCTDAASAQRIQVDMGHRMSVMDKGHGRCYTCDRYGRFLIMTLLDFNKIELLVKEFWGEQNLDQVL